MSRKIKYYDCKTAGHGLCYFCEKPTNYIFDNEKEEYFCCFACAVKHTKNRKVLNKIRRLEGKPKIVKKTKILHRDLGQNHEGELR